MSDSLFGTDGIRGRAGQYPIVHEIAFLLGRCFSELMTGRRFLIGMDTRESSPSLAAAVTAGCEQSGCVAELAGIVPTPVLAHNIRTSDYAGGIMITASHNPFQDNGLKLFGPDGQKVADTVQDQVETAILSHTENAVSVPSFDYSIPAGINIPYLDSYLNHLDHLGIIPASASDLLPVDCANGAATPLFQRLNERFSSPLVLTAADPDGRNINVSCGAAQTEHMRPDSAALDGDGDRIMFKDNRGHLVNGDHLLMFLVDRLPVKGVVGTVMTNQAVEQHCRKQGIAFERTEVGDRHVRYRMDETGATLGGETSGHLIYDPLNTTGDGTAVYLLVSHLMKQENLTLNAIWDTYPQMPQELLNIPVYEKIPFSNIPGFPELLHQAELIVSRSSGRVFPRYSGTENLLRILIESSSETVNQSVSDLFSEFFQSRRTS